MSLLKTRTRRIRFWGHLLTAYISRYKLRIVTFFLIVILTSFFLNKITPQIFRSKMVSLGYVGIYTLETIPTDILSLATDPLIAIDKSGKPVASLASHWTVSEDGQTYVIFLGDNHRWHDDSTINAKDISIAIENVQISALNNKAIEFKLPSRISSFPVALNKPVFKAKTFYGTGEFRIVGIDQVADIVREIKLVPKDNKLPKVDIKFYETEKQALNALKIGEIKSLNIVGNHSLDTWPNLIVEKQTDYNKIVTIFYNNADPDLSPEFRQSLTYAINKTDFEGEIASGPISPRNWAYNSTVKRYEYNTGRARELLTKTGPNSRKITLTVTEDLTGIAEAIKRDWEAVGVEVKLEFVKAVPKEFQALLAVNQLSPDPDQYALWHSTQKATNITKFSNKKIDKLLEDARAVQDENKRKELYFDFQRFLMEDLPATFLYHPFTYQITYKNTKPLIDKLPK